jgi:hypothetical protein
MMRPFLKMAVEEGPAGAAFEATLERDRATAVLEGSGRTNLPRSEF